MASRTPVARYSGANVAPPPSSPMFPGYQQSPRERFLAELRGKGRSRYKRYGGLPLRYAGGKILAVGHIVEMSR